MTADQPLPLAGVRVLAIEQMQSMPLATQLMARLGAEVIKVEHPVHGESGRSGSPSIEDRDGTEVGATFLRNNLNKQSIGVDLKAQAGAALITSLVPHVHVVAENFKASTMDRLGLNYDVLSALNPALVYVSISGFGHTPGPYETWPAYSIVAEAMSGLYSFRPVPDQPYNIGMAGAIGDNTSGLFAVIGTLAALRHAEATGVGQHVDVAMFDAMLAMMDLVPSNPSLGVTDNSLRAWPGIMSDFAAADGRFVIQVGREHQFERLAHAIGAPEWITDDRFATREDWVAHLNTVIRPTIESWASSMTRLDACHILANAGVVCGPSFEGTDLAADNHVAARQMITRIPGPNGGEVHIAGNPVKLSRTDEPPADRWPTRGEHTTEVLQSILGLSLAQVEDLRSAGVIA